MNFPADFRGKLVLLDFWATWCPPCRAERPVVAKAYERLRERRLDVVGVSLDSVQRVPASRVAEYVKEQNMTWPQIYADGQSIAAKYGLVSIPAALLVDGNTGAILASGEDLRGDRLAGTLEGHLRAVRRR